MALTQVSIREDILELSDDGPRLIGMRCMDCGNFVFLRISHLSSQGMG